MCLANITRVFPWWPTLHGWWRTNPGYNTVFSITDGGQDLEGQALALFKLGRLPYALLPFYFMAMLDACL